MFTTVLPSELVPNLNFGMNSVLSNVGDPMAATAPLYHESLTIGTTETATYKANLLPAWCARSAYIGNVSIDGFVGNNGIRPAYNTYDITLQPSAVVDRSGDVEYGGLSGTWALDNSYQSFKNTLGPDTAWATWALGRVASTSTIYTKLDSRRIPTPATFSYARIYQSWWDTDHNIFNGAEPDGGYRELESAFFVGRRSGDTPYVGATASYYLRDTGSINTPLSSANVPLVGWDYTWDKDVPLFDRSGTDTRTACLWQRTFSDTLSYPQIINDFTEIRATMVASCTMNERISIDLGVAPGWGVVKAELSLSNLWHPAGVALTIGSNAMEDTIVNATTGTCMDLTVSRLDVTRCVANGTLDLYLSGTNYADVNTASTWQDTWLGALNCYLDDGWIDVTVERTMSSPARIIPHFGQDPATRVESDLILSNLTSEFSAGYIGSRRQESLQFTLNGLDASLESMRGATSPAITNFTGLISTDGSVVTIDLRDGLHGWLADQPYPVSLVATWMFRHAPISGTALGQVLDPRVLPNFTAMTIVPLREFGTGDTACIDVCVDTIAVCEMSLPSARVELALFLNGSWIDAWQVNESINSSMARVRFIHAFQDDAPGCYQLEARMTCRNTDGSVATIDYAVVEPDLRVKSFSPGDAVVFPIYGGRKEGFPIMADHILLDPLMLDAGTSRIYADMPWSHGLPAVAFWNFTIAVPVTCTNVTTAVDLQNNRLSFEGQGCTLPSGKYEIAIIKPSMRLRVGITANSSGVLGPYTAGVNNGEGAGDITVAATSPFSRFFFNVSVVDASGEPLAVFKLATIAARIDLARVVGGSVVDLGSFAFERSTSSLLIPMANISTFGGIDYNARDIVLNFALAFNTSQEIYDMNGSEVAYALKVRRGLDITICIDQRLFGAGPCTCAGSTVSMYVDPPGIIDRLATIAIMSRDNTGRLVAVRAGLTITCASWENATANGTTIVARRAVIDSVMVSIPGSASLLVPTFSTTSLPGEPFGISIGGLQTNDSFVDLAYTSTRYTFTMPGQEAGTVVNGTALSFDVRCRPITLGDVQASCPIESGMPTATPSITFSASVSCTDFLSSTPAAGCWVEFLLDGNPCGTVLTDASGTARLVGLCIPALGTHAICARLATFTSGQVFSPTASLVSLGSICLYETKPPSNMTLMVAIRKSHVQLAAGTMPDGATDIPATASLGICPRLVDLDAGSLVTGLSVLIRVNGTLIPNGASTGAWCFIDASVPGGLVIDVTFVGNGGLDPAAIQLVIHVHRVAVVFNVAVDHAAPGDGVVLACHAWDELVQVWLAGIPVSFEIRSASDAIPGAWIHLGNAVTGAAGACSVTWNVPTSLAGHLVECRATTCPAPGEALIYGYEASPSIFIQIEKIPTAISIDFDVKVNETTSEATCNVKTTLIATGNSDAVAGAALSLTIYGRPVGFPAFVFMRQLNVTCGISTSIRIGGYEAIKAVAAFAGNSSHAGAIAEATRASTIVTGVFINGPETCVAGINVTYNIALVAAPSTPFAGKNLTVEIWAWQGSVYSILRILQFSSATNGTRIEISFETNGQFTIDARFSGDGTFQPARVALNVTATAKQVTRIRIGFPDGQEARVGIPMTISIELEGYQGALIRKAIVRVDIKNGQYYERVNVTIKSGVDICFTWIPSAAANFTIEAWYAGNTTIMSSKMLVSIVAREIQVATIVYFIMMAIAFGGFVTIVKSKGAKSKTTKYLMVFLCVFSVDIAFHFFIYAPYATAGKSESFTGMNADAPVLGGMAAALDNGMDSFPREAMAMVAPSLQKAQPFITAAIVEAEAAAGANATGSVGDLPIDLDAPEIRILTPKDGGVITGNDLIISARITDGHPGVEKAYFQVFRRGGVTEAVMSGFLECNETRDDPSIYSIIEDIGFFVDAEYTIIVNATDLANNSASASCRFALDHEIFVPDNDEGGGRFTPVHFLAEMLGMLNMSFVPTINGVLELAISREGGSQVIAPWIDVVRSHQHVEVLVSISPDFFAEGNYTLSMSVYTPNPYVLCREVYALTIDRKAIVIDLHAVGLDTTRDGSIAYTDHDFELVAVLAATTCQSSVAPFPASMLGGKRVDFQVYMNDTWVSAGFAVTDNRGVARLRFRFSERFSWQSFTLGGRGRYVFNSSFGGDASFKPQAGQAIIDHRGIRTVVQAIHPDTTGAKIDASPGDVVAFHARLVESRRPGEARPVGGAPVDFFAVDPSTRNRTYIGSNTTTAGTGIASLVWLVNLQPGVYTLASEYTGNGTHAPSVVEEESCLNVSRTEIVIEFAGIGQAPLLLPGSVTTIQVSLHAVKDARQIPLRGATVQLSVIDATGLTVEAGTAVTVASGTARFTFDPEKILGGSVIARAITLLASYDGTPSSRPATATVSAIVPPSSIRVMMDPVTVTHGSACTVVARVEQGCGEPVASATISMQVEGTGRSIIVENVTAIDGSIILSVARTAYLEAGTYALTFTVLDNATLAGPCSTSVANGITVLPKTTILDLVVPTTLPAHEQIPVHVRASDGAGDPVIAKVTIKVLELGSGATRSEASGWTNASGELAWLSAAMLVGQYTVRASINGDGNRLAASASVNMEVETIQADIVVQLASGDWFYPGDGARILVRGTADASWSQYVPVDVVVRGVGSGSNHTALVGTLLLEPGSPSAAVAWRIPAWWPTGDAVVEARINETLSPYRGSASRVLHVRSRTTLTVQALQSNGSGIGSVLYTNEAIHVQSRLREGDGDSVAGQVPLANGTLYPGNLDVVVSCSANTEVTRAVNATGDVSAGTWFCTCLVDPNASVEGQSIRVSYVGDSYHDAAEVVLRLAVRKRPASLSIISVERGSDGLHAAERPAWLYHRSDTIIVTGTLIDAVSATRGIGESGIHGASVAVLLDGHVVVTCTTADGGRFTGTFVPASFAGPTVFDVPDFCQAGYHVLSVAFAGDEAYLPNATTRDEALQVVEYMHVELTMRATEMSWSASEILFTITIRDEDFQVTTDAWLYVTIVRSRSLPTYLIESEEEVYSQYLTSGAYKFPVTSGGDFTVTIDRTGTWFDGLGDADNSTFVYWSEVDWLDEANAGNSVCWMPDHDQLLVNARATADCSTTVKVTIVNLAITWMPKIFVTYAFGLLTAAKSFKARLALRLMVYIIYWLLQDNVYLPDLVTGLVAMCVSWAIMAACRWAIQKVGTKIADAIVKRIVGPDAAAEARAATDPTRYGSGNGGGSGGTSGSSGTGGHDGLSGNGATTRDPSPDVASATSSAMRSTSTLSGKLVLAAWWVAGISMNSFAGGSGVSCAALEMSMPGSQSSSSVKEEFSGMLSIMRVVEIGLLAIGALVVTWQAVHEAERTGDIVERYLIRCLLSGVSAAFFTMTIIGQVLARISGSEAVGSVLVLFVLGVVVGMLIGTTIVEVIIIILEYCFHIDLASLDFWTRTFIEVMLELLRWSITLVVTYAFIASPGAIGSALLISILKELIVSMLKALLFDVIFWSLEAFVNEGLKRFKIFPEQNQADEQFPGLERVLEPEQVFDENIRDFIAKYWKTIGQSIDVYYIMHGRKHLWEWMAPVIASYIATNNLTQKLNCALNIETIKEKLLAYLVGSISRGEYPEPYAILCGMLDLMAHGYTVVYARFSFLRLFECDEVNEKGTTGSSCGPDIVAYKNENGQEVYAIVEAKQPDSGNANQISWENFRVQKQIYWESSRDHLRMYNSKSDYLKTMKIYYPKAAEICEKIRKYSDLRYNVLYVIGSVFQRKDIVVWSNENQISINSIKDSLANGGSFEIKLYELRNSWNNYPYSIPDALGEPARSVVFDIHPHLKNLLD